MAAYYTFASKIWPSWVKNFQQKLIHGKGRLLGTKEYTFYPKAFDMSCKEGKSIVKAFWSKGIPPGVLSIISFVCWFAGPSVVNPSLDIPKNTHYFLMTFFIKFRINEVKIVILPEI